MEGDDDWDGSTQLHFLFYAKSLDNDMVQASENANRTAGTLSGVLPDCEGQERTGWVSNETKLLKFEFQNVQALPEKLACPNAAEVGAASIGAKCAEYRGNFLYKQELWRFPFARQRFLVDARFDIAGSTNETGFCALKGFTAIKKEKYTHVHYPDMPALQIEVLSEAFPPFSGSGVARDDTAIVRLNIRTHVSNSKMFLRYLLVPGIMMLSQLGMFAFNPIESCGERFTGSFVALLSAVTFHVGAVRPQSFRAQKLSRLDCEMVLLYVLVCCFALYNVTLVALKRNPALSAEKLGPDRPLWRYLERSAKVNDVRCFLLNVLYMALGFCSMAVEPPYNGTVLWSAIAVNLVGLFWVSVVLAAPLYLRGAVWPPPARGCLGRVAVRLFPDLVDAIHADVAFAGEAAHKKDEDADDEDLEAGDGVLVTPADRFASPADDFVSVRGEAPAREGDEELHRTLDSALKGASELTRMTSTFKQQLRRSRHDGEESEVGGRTRM